MRPEHTKYARLQKSGQYAHTVLMTQFASRTLYAVPRVHVKSEVYFGLKSSLKWQEKFLAKSFLLSPKHTAQFSAVPDERLSS